MKLLKWAPVVVVGVVLATPSAALACRLGLGDRVWYDANGNGVQDAGETGINGVRVTISPGYYESLDGPYITEKMTQTGPGEFGDGYYDFRPVDCDVPYTIAVDLATVPAGYLPTQLHVGAAETDSNDPNGVTVTLPNVGFNYADLTIDFGFVPPLPPPPTGVGTGTPGYWKTHPEAWPVDTVTIGNVVYSQAQALTLLNTPVSTDKKLTMFMHLVSTKLNLLSGTDGSCITEDVAAADQWFITYGSVGNPAIRANSGAWRAGSATAAVLDDYNNGLLCAQHRD